MDKSLVEYARSLGVNLRLLRGRAFRDEPAYTDDIVQDTLLYIWSRMNKGTPVGACMAYRRTLKAHRQRTRRQKYTVDISTLDN